MRRLLKSIGLLCLWISTTAAHGPHSDHHHSSEERGDGGYGQMMPTDDAIALFKKRIRGDRDYQNRYVLGRLLIRKARETGSPEFYEQANKQLRDAKRIKPDHLGVCVALANTQMAKHDFRSAIDLLESLPKDHRGNSAVLATLGDAYLNIGDLDRAQTLYESLSQINQTPAAMARLAHLDELRGDLQAATDKLSTASERVKSLDLPKTDQSWYAWRVATLHWTTGNYQSALPWFNAALGHTPKDLSALLGRAKTFAAMGNVSRAEEDLRSLIATSPRPDAMVVLADLAIEKDDLETANLWINRAYDAYQLESDHSTAHHRVFANFLADYSIDTQRATELAQKDLQQRPDSYSFDAVAWALHRNGESQKANGMMQRALENGTTDVSIHFHAYKIKQAIGDDEAAEQHFQLATQLNPRLFDWLQNRAKLQFSKTNPPSQTISENQ